MSIPSKQQAVIIPTAKAPFEIATVDVPQPGSGELLIKVHAAGLNPVDWKIQKYDFFVSSYPYIVGTDGSGAVVAIGEGVAGYSLGDRVLFQGYFANRLATFQQYTVAASTSAAKIPRNLSYEAASSIPLALATSALGLYSPKPVGAGLTPAWESDGKGKYANEPFLLIGGASSVGQLAIQLAKLSGFSPIIVTASLKHADFLKSLGATHIIDRQEPLSALSSSVSKITSKPISVAYDAISEGGTQQFAYNALGSNGKLVIVLQKAITETPESGKEVYAVFGNINGEMHKNREVPLSLYSYLGGLLETGEIKPNRTRTLANGIKGIIPGLKELEEGVSGVKLIAQPNE